MIKFPIVFTILAILLLTGCTEKSTEAPSTTTAENKSLQNVSSRSDSNSESDGKIKINHPEETKPLEVQQAENLIRQYLELADSTDTIVEFDHEQKGKYVIHVYDIIDIEKNTEHIATRGWYLVDPDTQHIEVIQ